MIDLNRKVVLVHGFARNHKDMKVLKNNLDKLGYDSILVDLPLTYHKIEYSTFIFEGIIEGLISKLKHQEQLHLVGHSTGGLIIRSFLETSNYNTRIGRAVLIATPNQGAELAELAGKFGQIPTRIFKTLQSLQSQRVKSLKPLVELAIEIGAIAGNKNNLTLGKLLKGPNDGRVTVESVQIEGLKDFVVLPYGHLEIHKHVTTAKLVDEFLTTGNFKNPA